MTATTPRRRSASASAPLGRKERRKAERMSRKASKKTRSSMATTHSSSRPAKKHGDANAERGSRTSRRNNGSCEVKKETSTKPNGERALPAVAAAPPPRRAQRLTEQQLLIEKEDEEIRRLEAKLGIHTKKGQNRTKLDREYRLEGYGDGFVDFLDSLDRILEGGKGGDSGDDDSSSDDEDESAKVVPANKKRRRSVSRDEDDEEENSSADAEPDVSDDEEEEDDDDSAMVMIDPSDDDIHHGRTEGDSDSDSDQEEEDEGDQSDDHGSRHAQDVRSSDADDTSQSESGDDDVDESDGDNDERSTPDGTYRPARGQDIYGKEVAPAKPNGAPAPYVPPHLRQSGGNAIDSKHMLGAASTVVRHKDDDDQQARNVQAELNRALNRLSEDTLVPTVASTCLVYTKFPHSVVNNCLLDSVRRACVATRPTVLMVQLVPVYAAAVAGVHIRMGDSAQLAEHCMERIVLELWNALQERTTGSGSVGPADDIDNDPEGDGADKTPHNLLLLLGYLYNYGVVHCTLVYDIVRRLIEKLPAPLEVELLLLILGHCGRALRSDDPSALKEIVLSVQSKQKQQLEQQQQLPASNGTATGGALASSSSRVEYMIGAMMDLKNNKKRRQDSAHSERTAKIRKLLGQVKRNADTTGGRSSGIVNTSSSSSSSSSLRITLDDILHAETRGRWWKVGASWVGNQFQLQPGDGRGSDGAHYHSTTSTPHTFSVPTTSPVDETLLKLATKFRMNTDLRRSIFCVIMGSADCDDAFEKLVRGEMLKPRNEREAARVLMECCGGEKSFNKFYAHLAHRMCEFQPQCRFSFQLAFWDAFKRFDDMKARKVANLAKLLFHLVVVHRTLRLNVLKPIDMASPNNLAEPALLFLTIFFTHVMQQFDDASQVTELFTSGIASRRRKRRRDHVRKGSASDDEESEDDDGDDNDDDGSSADQLDAMDEGDALRASMLVFFVQVLKSSPDYANKEGTFRRNLKAAIKACDVDAFF